MEEGKQAAQIASETRSEVRRRLPPGHADRAALLSATDHLLRYVAHRLRQERARAAKVPSRQREHGEELKAAADAVQRERRKIWKMRNTKTRR